MFVDFEAVESENEDDDEQEEEDDDGQEPEEEDADHDIDVEEDPSPIDNEVEFVGEAVEQPVRIRSSLVSSLYTSSLLFTDSFPLLAGISDLAGSKACFLERVYIQVKEGPVQPCQGLGLSSA